MKVSIIGIGMGNPDTLTQGAARAIKNADCLIGAQRLLDCFKVTGADVFASSFAKDITVYLLANPQYKTAAVLMSGDVGFYSGAKALCKAFDDSGAGIECECVAGVSSVQYFCARLCTPWEDACLISMHARRQNLCAAVSRHNKTFVLTGSENTVQALCAELTAGGLGYVTVQAGERLSYDDEQITRGTAEELAGKSFASLSVMLITNDAYKKRYATHGLPDDSFLRGEAPMTKAEVRAVSVAALNLCQSDVLWDIGAGTGSVSVEAARVLPFGCVYAVEKNADALELLQRNKERFGVSNLNIIAGVAPEALAELPAPDAVFIGGSSGKIGDITAVVLDKNPRARIVINAITLETTSAAISVFKERKLINQSIVQLSVARAKRAGQSHMMMGQNPVYIISGGGCDEP